MDANETKPAPATPAPKPTRDVRTMRRFGLEHAIASALTLLLTGGGLTAVTSLRSSVQETARDLEHKLEDKIDKKFEDQATAIGKLQLTLASMREHLDSSDKAADRLAVEHARAMEQLRALENTTARTAARLDDYERRFAALEQRK